MQTIGWTRLITAMAGGFSRLSFVENFTTGMEVVRIRFAHVYQSVHRAPVLLELRVAAVEMVRVDLDLASRFRQGTNRPIHRAAIHVQKLRDLKTLFLPDG
jgi:hypothetical protein